MAFQPQKEQAASLYTVPAAQDINLVLNKETVVRKLWLAGELPTWQYLRALDMLLRLSGADSSNGQPMIQLVSPRETAMKKFNLSRREVEILDCVSEGFGNREIGQQMFIAEQTVKFHLTNIYRKLKVGNRTQASRIWQLAQLG